MHTPSAIATESFALIRTQLQRMGIALDPELVPIVERVVHSSADFEFAGLLRASTGAVAAGVAALQAGACVLTDVEMVRVGISARRLGAFGGVARCLVAEEETRALALAAGTTRSAMGFRRAAALGLLDGAIVAIGNAPTALEETIRLIETGARPALVIGVPVGFVGTAESKAALARVSAVPWIVVDGCKGGSTIAVAIVNALLRLAVGADAAEVD